MYRDTPETAARVTTGDDPTTIDADAAVSPGPQVRVTVLTEHSLLLAAQLDSVPHRDRPRQLHVPITPFLIRPCLRRELKQRIDTFARNIAFRLLVPSGHTSTIHSFYLNHNTTFIYSTLPIRIVTDVKGELERLEEHVRNLSDEEVRELLLTQTYKVALMRSQIEALTETLTENDITTYEAFWEATHEHFQDSIF
jgi:hypothetical protein